MWRCVLFGVFLVIFYNFFAVQCHRQPNKVVFLTKIIWNSIFVCNSAVENSMNYLYFRSRSCCFDTEKHKNRFKFDAVDCWEVLFELFWSSFKCYLSSFQGKANGSLQSIIVVFFSVTLCKLWRLVPHLNQSDTKLVGTI